MGENGLKSQDTFSVIPLIHPFYYLPGCSIAPARKRISYMTWKRMLYMMWNGHDINGCKFSLKSFRSS